MAKQWINKCEHEHEECPGSDLAELPTRLIEISPPGAPEYARITSTKGRKGIYAALSYCWGGPRELASTTANFEAYHEMLPYPKLPQTVLDAFQIARDLGLRYIWIRSLCIIQEDQADVDKEMAQMLQVYQNALVTMCVAGAETCQEGFLQKKKHPDGPSYVPIRIDQERFAWTLQEAFSSQRLLILSNNGIKWDTRFERWGFLVESGEEIRKWTIEHPETEDSLWHEWCSWTPVLENYTQRDLSCEIDILPEFAAIVEVFPSRFNYEYLAGHWRKLLEYNLAWESTTPKSRPRAYQASVFGDVTYGELMIEGHLEELRLYANRRELLYVDSGIRGEGVSWDALENDDGKTASSDELYLCPLSYSSTWLLTLEVHLPRDDSGPYAWKVGGIILGRL
ncbi:HET-domain-containing protein [Acephala macrosclerotiorum]|nr:HET-domain-containing protein [Acephala macrosclerotiorum]